jgi:hypothetical protein
MKLATLLAFVGALPLPTKSARLPDWKKSLTAALFALHESRRREAARHIARHQYLLDRYAQPPSQQPSAAGPDDKATSA